MIDYYAVLGVSPEATLAEIKAAFRRKAMEAHPDRGGSHEEMTRLNEAWEVLSDVGLRAAYDAARGTHSPSTLANWQKRSEGARRRAKDYPREWEAFEAWMDALAVDVRRAQYGVTGAYFFVFPTAGPSVSGWLCILTGAIAATVFCWMTTSYREFVLREFGNHHPFPTALVIVGPAMAGGWAGYYVHRLFRDELIADEQKRAKKRSGAPSTDGGPAFRVVACGNCGKRLRVPSLKQRVEAKCPECGKRVAVGPA